MPRHPTYARDKLEARRSASRDGVARRSAAQRGIRWRVYLRSGCAVLAPNGDAWLQYTHTAPPLPALHLVVLLAESATDKSQHQCASKSMRSCGLKQLYLAGRTRVCMRGTWRVFAPGREHCRMRVDLPHTLRDADPVCRAGRHGEVTARALTRASVGRKRRHSTSFVRAALLIPVPHTTSCD